MPKTRDPAPTNTCKNCGGVVQARRPSTTGLHFCQRPDCKAAKQREYQALKTRQIKSDDRAVQVRFLHNVLHSPRMQCPSCGLVNALPGYAHRDRDGGGCSALGMMHPAIRHASWVDTVWPEPREYADVEAS